MVSGGEEGEDLSWAARSITYFPQGPRSAMIYIV